MTPISNLKAQLETIRFGILKASPTRMLEITPSCIIKVREVDHEGYIWCSITDDISEKFLLRENFTAKLKFVRKAEGLFIMVHGQATFLSPRKSPTNNGNGRHRNDLLLKIKILDAQYYRKKSLSIYTSVLQAINGFSTHHSQPAKTGIALL